MSLARAVLLDEGRAMGLLSKLLLGSLCFGVTPALAQSAGNGFTQTSKPGGPSGSLDYVNPKPMPMPQSPGTGLSRSPVLPQAIFPGSPGFSPGAVGSGATNPVRLAPSKSELAPQQSGGGQVSQDFGAAGLPFNTFRVSGYNGTDTSNYPYRAAGLLLFLIGSDTYQCSASLIKPGIVVTAAHCVANFGKSRFYSGWQFSPGYDNGVAPYGVWTASTGTVLTSYFNGTDPCTVRGVVCENDVAVLTLDRNADGALPGPTTGYLGVGINGYSFVNKSQALVSQLGYAASLDDARRMLRNDSQGTVDPNQNDNTLIGTLLTGGSSGGPWLVNLGQPPSNTGRFGAAPIRNVVVGVTSWGYDDGSVKEEGASPFTSGNLSFLLNAACSAAPGDC